MGAGTSRNVSTNGEAQNKENGGANTAGAAGTRRTATTTNATAKAETNATSTPTNPSAEKVAEALCPPFVNGMPDEVVVPSLLLPRRTHNGSLMRPKAPPPGVTFIALRRLPALPPQKTPSQPTTTTKANTDKSPSKTTPKKRHRRKSSHESSTGSLVKGSGHVGSTSCIFMCNVASTAVQSGAGTTLSSLVGTNSAANEPTWPNSLLQLALAGPPPQNMTTVNSVTVPHPFPFRSPTDKAIGVCLLISYVVNDDGKVAGLKPRMNGGKPRKGFNLSFPATPVVRVADEPNASGTPPLTTLLPTVGRDEGNPLRASGYDSTSAAHSFYNGYDSADGAASSVSSENTHHRHSSHMIDLYSANSSTSTFSGSNYSCGVDSMNGSSHGDKIDEDGNVACLVTVLDKPKVVDKETVPGLKPEMVMQSLLVRISSFKGRPAAGAMQADATTPPMLRRSRSQRRSMRLAVATLRTRWCLFNDSRTHEAHIRFTYCYDATSVAEGNSNAVRLLCRPTPHFAITGNDPEGRSAAMQHNASVSGNTCYVEIQESKLSNMDDFWAHVPANCSYHNPHTTQSSPSSHSEDAAAVQARLKQRVRANAQTRVLLSLAPGASVMVVEGPLAAYHVHVVGVPFRKEESLAVMGAFYTAEEVRAARQQVAERGRSAPHKKTGGKLFTSLTTTSHRSIHDKNRCYHYNVVYVNMMHESEGETRGNEPVSSTATIRGRSPSPSLTNTTTARGEEKPKAGREDVFVSPQGLHDFGPLVNVVDTTGRVVHSPGTTPPSLFPSPSSLSAAKRSMIPSPSLIPKPPVQPQHAQTTLVPNRDNNNNNSNSKTNTPNSASATTQEGNQQQQQAQQQRRWSGPRHSVPPMTHAVHLKRKPITAHLGRTSLPPLKDAPGEAATGPVQQATTTITTTMTSAPMTTATAAVAAGEGNVQPGPAANAQHYMATRGVSETSISIPSPSASCATLPKLPSGGVYGRKRGSLAAGTNGRSNKGAENESDRDLSSSTLSMQF